MDLNDLDNSIKQCRPGAGASGGQTLPNTVSVIGMAALEHVFEHFDRRGIAERFSRDCRMRPSDREASIWGPETTSQDIVEGIEVPAPEMVRDQDAGDFIIERLQGRYPRAIDDMLACDFAPLCCS
ncbi:hypothetical protein QD461_18395 [Rhizobium sp. BR 314]